MLESKERSPRKEKKKPKKPKLTNEIIIRVPDDMFLGYSGMKKIKKSHRDLLEALKKGTDRQWVTAYKDL